MNLFLGFCGLLALLSLLRFPLFIASDELDPSWNQAFNYFAVHRLHVGTDYIFTYGPMAFLITETYEPHLFAIRVLWELFFKGLIVGGLWRLGRACNASWWQTGAIFLATALLFGGKEIQTLHATTADVAGYFSIAVFVLLLAVDRTAATTLPVVLAVVFIAAVLSLIKLTLLPLCLLLVALATYRWIHAGKPWFLSPALAFAFSWLALWFGSGQGLGNLSDYARGSVAITSGYAATMMEGGRTPPTLPFAIVAILSIATALMTLPALYRVATETEKMPRAVTVLASLTVLTLALIAFKHGFVRADLHAIIALAVLFLLNSLLGILAISKGGDLWKRLCYPPLLGALLTMGAMHSYAKQYIALYVPVASASPSFADQITRSVPVQNFYQLTTLGWTADAMEEERKKLQQLHPLTRTRAEVKGATIDVWSYEQGIVLLQGMNYHPRPGFQSYSVYNSYLKKINEAFYRSDAAPEYVLFKMQAIDNRFPTTEDSTALAVILARYQPLLVEENYLLLKRKPGMADKPEMGAKETPAQFDTEISIPAPNPGNTQFLSLDIHPSLTGKAIAVLWKPAPISMTVTFADGTNQIFRIVSEITSDPFLLNPFLGDTGGVARYLTRGDSGKRIISIELHNPPTPGGSFYQNSFVLRSFERPTGGQ